MKRLIPPQLSDAVRSSQVTVVSGKHQRHKYIRHKSIGITKADESGVWEILRCVLYIYVCVCVCVFLPRCLLAITLDSSASLTGECSLTKVHPPPPPVASPRPLENCKMGDKLKTRAKVTNKRLVNLREL